jgi:peptidoglycan/LPS O-acetylase OafA/YrhL
MLCSVRKTVERLIRFYDTKDLRQNNLDLLRLLFSYAVVYFHCVILSGAQERVLPPFYSVDSAVQGFFLVSGYLIFSSYERSSTLKSYFAKRARRIYPAYFFVVLAAAFGLYFVSQENAAGYFGTAWVKYVAANLTFLNFAAPTLPGVFTQNLAPAVNGSLWTIKVEVAFYLAVPVFVSVMRWGGRLPVLIFLYMFSYLYYLGFKILAAKTGHSFYEELAKQLPGQMRYFALGGAIYYYDAQIRKYLGLLGLAALLISCFVNIEDLWFWKPILLACMVFAVAFGPFLLNVGLIGDLSYAAYLFHFPIVQLGVDFGLFGASAKLAILAIFGIVTALAYISWHLLEKPFLPKTSHYVQAEMGNDSGQPTVASQRERSIKPW